jgi:hypothetical protein
MMGKTSHGAGAILRTQRPTRTSWAPALPCAALRCLAQPCPALPSHAYPPTYARTHARHAPVHQVLHRLPAGGGADALRHGPPRVLNVSRAAADAPAAPAA